MTIKLTKEQKSKPILKAVDLFPILRDILAKEGKADQKKEHFWCVGLHSNLVISFIELVSLGADYGTIADPVEVFYFAVHKGIKRIILAHNHPSGTAEPSKRDKDQTERMIKAGEILKIEVLDHMIITPNEYYSFAENYEFTIDQPDPRKVLRPRKSK